LEPAAVLQIVQNTGDSTSHGKKLHFGCVSVNS
jgi:hypothetical protein